MTLVKLHFLNAVPDLPSRELRKESYGNLKQTIERTQDCVDAGQVLASCSSKVSSIGNDSQSLDGGVRPGGEWRPSCS